MQSRPAWLARGLRRPPDLGRGADSHLERLAGGRRGMRVNCLLGRNGGTAGDCAPPFPADFPRRLCDVLERLGGLQRVAVKAPS